MSDATRKFHTLDGIRGVAAIMVLTRHAPEWFNLPDTNSYLGVDLFFILSGFVLENAYGSRLASRQLGATRFIIMRWIRLAPLFFMATAVSMALAIAQSRHSGNTPAAIRQVLFATPNLFIIPNFYTAGMFGYVGVAWTVFFELVVNVLFVLFYPRLTNARLVIVALCALGAVTGAIMFYTLNEGWSWPTAWLGLARVLYGFPLGVLLRRFHDKLPTVKIGALIVLILTGVLLGVPTSWPGQACITLLTVAVALPLLVHIGAKTEPSRRWFSTCTLLGVASYPFYILQSPFIEIIRRKAATLTVDPARVPPLSGAVLVAIWFVVTLGIERYYDRPVRGWLSRKLLLKHSGR